MNSCQGQHVRLHKSYNVSMCLPLTLRSHCSRTSAVEVLVCLLSLPFKFSFVPLPVNAVIAQEGIMM
eukprot:1104994-Pelagomonas_calceolata.AAC.2